MTILCESDRAAAAALRTALESAGPVETVPDLASAASLIEAKTDEDLVVVGADATVAEVPGFGPGNNSMLRGEVRGLARRHLDAFLHAARSRRPRSSAAPAWIE